MLARSGGPVTAEHNDHPLLLPREGAAKTRGGEMADRRHYELMLIVDPRLEDATIQQAIDRYVSVVGERGGEATKVDHWGRRKLAYEITHLDQGYYTLIDFQAEPAAMVELDRVLGLADEVVRHKIVRPGKD
jgi:small subunit ribosomal protein S6